MVYRALNSRRSINLNFEGGEWLRNCMDRHWQIKIVFDINVLLFYVQSVNPAFHLSNAWVHNLVVLSPRTRTGGDGDGGGGGCLWWDFSSFFLAGIRFFFMVDFSHFLIAVQSRRRRLQSALRVLHFASIFTYTAFSHFNSRTLYLSLSLSLAPSLIHSLTYSSELRVFFPTLSLIRIAFGWTPFFIIIWNINDLIALGISI